MRIIVANKMRTGRWGLLWICLLGFVACETDILLGQLTPHCADKACGEPCQGPTGEELCDSDGLCRLARPICDPACSNSACGDVCVMADGEAGVCNEIGVCTVDLPFCVCLGQPCGAPCDACENDSCQPSNSLRYCHSDGRCLLNKPDCPPGACGTNADDCQAGDYCCNDSCGTCSAIGAYCDTWSCTTGLTPCGAGGCSESEYCCDSNCGVCAPLGTSCLSAGCADEDRWTPCGDNLCFPGQVCCNPSCGICVNPGESCAETSCDTDLNCGMAHCKAGEVCCNASCGMCVPAGGDCPQFPCSN